MWIAKRDGTVVGYCFVRKGAMENYIEGLYILPSEQGKRTGSKLMEQAFAWLGTDKPIGLGVATYNQKTIEFYKKMGFEEMDEGPEAIPPFRTGKVIPLVKMIRKFGK